MSSLVRGLIGVCTISGVCGAGYGLNKLLSKDDIANKLKANGYTLLTKNDQNWENILTSYRETIKVAETLKFDDFIGNSVEDQNAKTKLQQLCEKHLNKRTFEDDEEKNIYKKAEKWCTVPQTVQKRLSYLGFKVLETEVADGKENKDKKEWGEKLTLYISQNNTKKITNPPWESQKEPTKVGEEETTNFMKKCKELQEKKTHQQDYEQAFEDAKRWCAI